METIKVELDPKLVDCQSESIQSRIQIRTMSADDFITLHGSGTLRKNKNLGMAWNDQYLEERVRYEFGWGFKMLPRSRVTLGDAITEGDCKPVTETGWHAERYINMSIFPEDCFEVKHLHVEYPDGELKEGLGIVVRQTSAPWIPKGHLVFAIIAEFNAAIKKWSHARNPF